MDCRTLPKTFSMRRTNCRGRLWKRSGLSRRLDFGQPGKADLLDCTQCRGGLGSQRFAARPLGSFRRGRPGPIFWAFTKARFDGVVLDVGDDAEEFGFVARPMVVRLVLP